MFYPFFGALSFILTLCFLSISGMIILIHKTDSVQYSVQRYRFLLLCKAAGAVNFYITIYCIAGTEGQL